MNHPQTIRLPHDLWLRIRRLVEAQKARSLAELITAGTEREINRRENAQTWQECYRKEEGN